MKRLDPFARLHQQLLDLRAQLQNLAATGDHAAAVVELDQTRVGRLSRMDAMQAQGMARASVERRRVMLQKAEAALQRIDDGEYGFCAVCAESIDPRRLEIDPTATLCIGCAEKKEH